MLKVKNINIVFDRPIIINQELNIYNNQITVLCGESGSGKSSLLNVLGLLDETSTYTYEWNYKAVDKKDYNELKRTQISYVFQDYNMIDDLSILDNFKVMFNIAGLTYSKERMLELLKQVSIDASKIKQKSKSLSGGEKQRVSIALALVKHPKLLLLDEPTANLDEENAKIIVEILHKLKRQGLMIVIASHHPHLYDADHIYTINDQRLEETYQTEIKEDVVEIIEENRKKFNPFNFSFINVKRHFIIYLLMAIALTYSMQNMLETSFWVTNSAFIIHDYGNTLIDTDIFIKDMERYFDYEEEKNIYYYSGADNFEKEKIKKIKELDHIEDVYAYHASTTRSGFTLDGQRTDDLSELDTVSTDTNSINTYENDALLNDYVSTVVCDEDKMINRSIELDSNVENGVFIPKKLAMELGITELNHTKLHFNMAVSVATCEGRWSTMMEDGPSEEVTLDGELMLVIPTTYEIKGIYENVIYQNNSVCGVEIFIDHHEYERVQQELLKQDSTYTALKNIEEWANEEGLNFEFGNFTSVYIVEVADYQYVEDVAQNIRKVSDDIYVKTIEDTKDNINGYITEAYFTNLMMPLVIGVVAILLISLLYSYSLIRRKKEFAFIKAHGIHKIQNSTLIDMVYLFICITPIIVFMTYPLISLLYQVSRSRAFTMLCYLVVLLGIVLYAMIIGICYLVSKWYFKKHDVIKELRSK